MFLISLLAFFELDFPPVGLAHIIVEFLEFFFLEQIVLFLQDLLNDFNCLIFLLLAQGFLDEFVDFVMRRDYGLLLFLAEVLVFIGSSQFI